MTRFRLFGGLLAVVASAVSSNTVHAQQSKSYVPGELLVGIRSSSRIGVVGPETDRSIGAVLSSIPQLGVMRVRIAPGFTMEQAAAKLRARNDVAYVEQNSIYSIFDTPNDALYSNQYAPAKVQADLAWPLWVPKRTVIVAIVDTGVDYSHPDLTNKILRENGAVVGYNTVGSNARSSIATDTMDDNKHGTHCAGIAAGQVNNAIGMAGISGWSGAAGSTDTSTMIMPVKVMDSTGGGNVANIASGVTWAADHGAHVISLSLGGYASSTTLMNAVAYARGKGCVVVAAAGNDRKSLNTYPASYAGVISVAATDSTDTLSTFSNYGTWVTCAAPGTAIYSTLPVWLGGTTYGKLSGTSMATPLVAGEAAFLMGHFPSLSGVEIETLIKSNTDPYTPYSGRTIAAGAGRVNVYKALQAAWMSWPPSTPSGLKATARSAQVTLTWNASGGATSYKVKRATTTGGPYTTVAGPAGTSFTNTELTNGTTYYYVVSAVNNLGESANSAEVSSTPIPPPNTPAGLTATAISGQVSLSWAVSTGAASYNVKRATVKEGPFTKIASSNGTTYINTGLTNGTTYYYVVSAVNTSGESADTPYVQATPIAPPSAPTGLTATGSFGQIVLTWNASATATSYNIKRSTTSAGPYTKIGTATGATYSNTGLPEAALYYYVVSAANYGGTSADSTQASAITRATQLLIYPGFEGSFLSPWVASSPFITNYVGGGRAPRTGAWYAYLGGYGSSHTDTLYQQVTIPSDVTSATLSFYLKVLTAETSTNVQADRLYVLVTDTSGAVLSTLAVYSNLNKGTSYVSKSFNLIAHKGKTIRIHLTGTEDPSRQTSFLVDDFALKVQ